MQAYDAVDLFAGPGGFDLGAQRLGLDVIGIEFDHAACETRRAAGHPTVDGDVREYGPADFNYPRGLIASPPCQTFSVAGNGSGRRQLDEVRAGISSLVFGWPAEAGPFSDERTGLILEPLRWVLEARRGGRPFQWVALEQVPTVKPVWEAYAVALQSIGYHVDTGVLNAEQYGVPQTRRRAILIAHLDRPVSLPAPTHSRYYSRDPQRLDEGVKPWVSMAEALGWDADMVVRSNYGTGGESANRGTRQVGRNVRFSATNIRPNTALRDATQPAPTLAFGHERPRWVTERGKTLQLDKGSVRVTVEEAATLQSFPRGYPWQGSETKQYLQIGNAIPPLLAEAVLRQVL